MKYHIVSPATLGQQLELHLLHRVFLVFWQPAASDVMRVAWGRARRLRRAPPAAADLQARVLHRPAGGRAKPWDTQAVTARAPMTADQEVRVQPYSPICA